MANAPKIVLSYRREDTQAATHMIFDRLATHFGRQSVYLDYDSNVPGVDFRSRIRSALHDSDAVLAIIGPDWCGVRTRGTNRLNEPEDWVRIEIETALEYNARIIPILVDAAQMPAADQLPDSIRKLATLHAMKIDTGLDFDVHADRLIKTLDNISPPLSDNGAPSSAAMTGAVPHEDASTAQSQRGAHYTRPDGQGERSMNVTEIVTALIVAALLIAALLQLSPFLSRKIGAALASLSMFAAAVCLAFSTVIFRRYAALLSASASPAGSQERRDYEALRNSLADGGSPTRIYAQWLEKALHAVERFFGDADQADKTLFPHAFGLVKRAPLWTAPALNGCILLAFLYPVSMITLFWVISGRVGPAEAVFGLPPDRALWVRIAALVGWALCIFGYLKCRRLLIELVRIGKTQVQNPAAIFQNAGLKARYRRQIALWFACVFTPAAIVSDKAVNTSNGSVSGTVILASSIAGAVAGDVKLAAMSAAGGSIVGTIIGPQFGTFGAAMAAGVAVLLFALADAAINAAKHSPGRHANDSLFLPLFLTSTIIGSICAAFFLSSSAWWPVAGPILLYYALLSALNAPFDWLSLGLTRALLWRGLERKNWWPYFYALVDASLAVLLVAILAIVMVVGIQTIDFAAILGGGKPVLPVVTQSGTNVVPLLEGIKNNPSAPEYWWVYVLLLSTMLPSLFNLTIGGLSLTRGIPPLSRYLHARLPATEPVAPYDRNWIALVLMIQWFAGIGLGVLAQVVLIWGIFGHFLPGVGIDLLDLARSVAIFDLPAQVLRLF